MGAVIGEEGEVATNILLASISTALHLGNGPVTGQGDQIEKIDKNPTVFVNPAQPLMASVEVDDKEIVAQEERVKEARDRLASAIKPCPETFQFSDIIDKTATSQPDL